MKIQNAPKYAQCDNILKMKVSVSRLYCLYVYRVYKNPAFEYLADVNFGIFLFVLFSSLFPIL